MNSSTALSSGQGFVLVFLQVAWRVTNLLSYNKALFEWAIQERGGIFIVGFDLK